MTEIELPTVQQSSVVEQIIATENPEGPVSDTGNDVSDHQGTTTGVPQDIL